MTTTCFDLLAIVIAMVTLPVVLEVAGLTLASWLPRRASKVRAGSGPIQLAVIVPAHNEEGLISRCVASLRESASGSGARIFVVAHNCSDETVPKATQAGAEVLVCNDPKNKGKVFALLHGFEHALGCGCDAFLVVDADSTVSSNLIGVVSGALAQGARAVQCRYELDVNPERPRTRLTALAFRGFNFIRARGRERVGLSSGIFGNGFAIQRSLLAQNPYNCLSVVEDLEYHLQLLLAGERVHFLEDATVSSCPTNSPKGEITQRSRWEGGRISVSRKWMMPLLSGLAKGRLRLLEPVLDLASLPLGYAIFFLLLALLVPLTWPRAYSLLALAAIGVHVLAAAWSGPDFSADLRILSRVPGYILWKLRILPRLFTGSGRDADWIRTEREAPVLNSRYEIAKPLMTVRMDNSK